MPRQGRFNWTGGARSIQSTVMPNDHITVSGRCADRGLMLDQRTIEIIDKIASKHWWRTYQCRPRQVSSMRSTGKNRTVYAYPARETGFIDAVIDGMLAEYLDGEVPESVEVLPPKVSIAIIEQQFGIRFRSFQFASLEKLLLGHNVILHVPTGSGKSIVFQAASRVLFERGVTLAIYPLKSLLQDQKRSADARGITAITIDGDTKGRRRKNALKQIRTNPKVSMVLTTPETLMESRNLRSALLDRKVALVVVDEAHVYDEWALSFRNSYQKLGEILPELGKDLRVLLCSATLTAKGAVNAVNALKIYEWECVVRRAVRPNLKFATLKRPVDDFLIDAHSRNPARKDGPAPGIAFFCWVKSLKATADEIRQSLNHIPIIYHGQMSPASRRAAQSEWTTHDRWILATKAFGMGIDKPNVRTILHAQLPASILDYAQEVGRGGRDGKETICYLPKADYMGWKTDALGKAAEFLISISYPTVMDIKSVWKALEEIIEQGRWCDVDLDALGGSLGLRALMAQKCVSWLALAGMVERRVLAEEWEFIFPSKSEKSPSAGTLKQLKALQDFLRRDGYRRGAGWYVGAIELEDEMPALMSHADGSANHNWREKLTRWRNSGYVIAEPPSNKVKTRLTASSWGAWDASDAPVLLKKAYKIAVNNFNRMHDLAEAAPEDRASMIERAISLDVETFKAKLAQIREAELVQEG